MSVVADRIKQCREERGMSADELAKILGKDRSTIFRYEKDEIGNIPISVITGMAVALDVNPGYLMGWTDEKTSFRNKEPVTQMDDEHAELNQLYDALDQGRKDQLMSFLRFLATGTGR